MHNCTSPYSRNSVQCKVHCICVWIIPIRDVILVHMKMSLGISVFSSQQKKSCNHCFFYFFIMDVVLSFPVVFWHKLCCFQQINYDFILSLELVVLSEKFYMFHLIYLYLEFTQQFDELWILLYLYNRPFVCCFWPQVDKFQLLKKRWIFLAFHQRHFCFLLLV